MRIEADIAEPRDQAGSAAHDRSPQRDHAAHQQAALQLSDPNPMPSVTPGNILARAISAVGCSSHHEDDRQAHSSASDVTALQTPQLRQSSQSDPELSSASTQHSAGDQDQQQPSAAAAAQGNGSTSSTTSSSSVQPSQQQPAKRLPKPSPFAGAAAAAPPAGLEAQQEALPGAASGHLPSPVGTAAGAAAGAAAVPPRMQPPHSSAAAAAAASQELVAALNVYDPFGQTAAADAAKAAAAAAAAAPPPPPPPAVAAHAPADQVSAASDAYTVPFGQRATPAAAAMNFAPSLPPPDIPPFIGEADFEDDYAGFAACVPPSADAGPAAIADPDAVVDLRVWGMDNMVFSYYRDIPLSKEGSYGDVYLGIYGEHKHYVAVKVLKAGFGESLASLQKMLLDEVAPQRAVQHPGVVKVLAVCFDPLAIVTELCMWEAGGGGG